MDPTATTNIVEKLEQYFDAASQVIAKYSSDAVELGLVAMQIDAASSLVPAIFAMGVGIYAVRKCVIIMGTPPTRDQVVAALSAGYYARSAEDNRVITAVTGQPSDQFVKLPEHKAEEVADHYMCQSSTGKYRISAASWFTQANAPYLAIAVPGSIFILFSAFEVIDIWNWVGIFKPEVYAVHKFLLK